MKKIFSAIGTVTGISVVSKVIKKEGADIIGTSQAIYNVAKTSIEHEKKTLTKAEIKAMEPQQAFAVQMKAAGFKPSHLPILRQQTAIAVYVLAIAFLIVLGVFLVFPGQDNSTKLLQGLFLAAMATTIIQKSYQNWIFRNQKHGSLIDFIKSKDLLPKP